MATPLKTFPYTCNARHLNREIMGDEAKKRDFKFGRITNEKVWLWKLYNHEGIYKFRNLAQVEVFFSGFDAAKVPKQMKEEKKPRSKAFEDLISKPIVEKT